MNSSNPFHLNHANPFRLAAAMRARGADVQISQHAIERSLQRTCMSPSRLRELIAARAAVVLPWRSSDRTSERTYHLMFDKVSYQFVVAVLAGGAPGTSIASVVTVLTRAQFANDVGAISARQLRRAASRVLDPVAFLSWEEQEFACRTLVRRYRVISYYPKDDQSAGAAPAHIVFKNAPVRTEFVEEHSLGSAGAHPGFWEWYRREAERAGLPVERVVAIRIADTDKVELDISAEPRECPCCARRAAERAH
jgi:hypothetical protein